MASRSSRATTCPCFSNPTPASTCASRNGSGCFTRDVFFTISTHDSSDIRCPGETYNGRVADPEHTATPRRSPSTNTSVPRTSPQRRLFATPTVGVSQTTPAWLANPQRAGCRIPWPSRSTTDGGEDAIFSSRSTNGTSRYEKYVGMNGNRVDNDTVRSSTTAPIL